MAEHGDRRGHARSWRLFQTTARCCALRFPTLPSSHPAPPGLAALGKNFTAKGKPLQVSSGCCLQIEQGFKDSLGRGVHGPGPFPRQHDGSADPWGSCPLSAAIRLLCCCLPSPAIAGAPATSPATSQGLRLSSPHGRRDGRCWCPVSGLHSFLSVLVLSQLICFCRRGVVGCASAGFPAVRVRNGT